MLSTFWFAPFAKHAWNCWATNRAWSASPAAESIRCAMKFPWCFWKKRRSLRNRRSSDRKIKEIAWPSTLPMPFPGWNDWSRGCAASASAYSATWCWTATFGARLRGSRRKRRFLWWISSSRASAWAGRETWPQISLRWARGWKRLALPEMTNPGAPCRNVFGPRVSGTKESSLMRNASPRWKRESSRNTTTWCASIRSDASRSALKLRKDSCEFCLLRSRNLTHWCSPITTRAWLPTISPTASWAPRTNFVFLFSWSQRRPGYTRIAARGWSCATPRKRVSTSRGLLRRRSPSRKRAARCSRILAAAPWWSREGRRAWVCSRSPPRGTSTFQRRA